MARDIRSAIRTAAVRIAAAAIAAYGIHGSFALGIGSRLMAEVTMQFWNFDEPTVGFFFHVASISGLYICATFYSMKLAARFRNRISKG